MNSSTAKICIVAVNYFPEVTGCAPYSTDLAEHLVQQGYEVTVVTALPHYPQWKIPQEYRSKDRRTEFLNGVTVLRCPIFVPKKMSAISRVMFEASFLFSAFWRSKSLKPDLVIAVSPALADIVVGARIAKHRKIPYGILVQDLMTAATTQSNISGGDKVTGLASAIESRYLKQADSVAAITDSFSKSIKELGVAPEQVSVSPNYSVKNIERIPRNQARDHFGWAQDTFIVTHTGNMGLKQDLGNLISAIENVDLDHVQLLLVGDGSQRAELEEQAAGSAKIKFMDLVAEADYSALLSASDVLLLNEAPTITDMSLPSKLTAYESSGRPILGAVVPGGNTSKVLEKLEMARQVVAGDPEKLAKAIKEMATQEQSQNSSEVPEANQNRNSDLRQLRIDWVTSLLR